MILTRLFPDATLVRSRAPDWIRPGPDRIVYDVGGAYDPDARIFDHHQRGAPTRADGAPYSSFGLIWKSFGRDYLALSGIRDAEIDGVHALSTRVSCCLWIWWTMARSIRPRPGRWPD